MPEDNVRRILMYATFAECFAAFTEADGKQGAIRNGMWRWTDWYGAQHSIKVESAKRKIRKAGVWAFTQNKKTIHLWIKDSAIPLSAIIGVIAHEMGHIQRPYHRSYHDEETKAGNYENVAYNAAGLAERVIEKMANDGR